MTFKRMAVLILVLLAMWAALPPGCGMAAEDDGKDWTFDEFYKYDKAQPFNLTEELLRETDDYRLYLWSYDSVHDKRVTAWYSVPKNLKGPAPSLVIFHSYPSSKSSASNTIEPASKAGYICLALDAEYMGDRKVEGKDLYSKLAYSARDGMIQTMVDYRRAVDLLETRPEADPERVGLVGASMGGILGALAMSIEPRFRAGALAVGGAEWGYLLKASVVAQALHLTEGEHPLDPDEFRKIIAPADPIHWAQNISPRPVLMLNAKHDILVNQKAVKLLFARMNPPKRIVWFDSDHALPFDAAMGYAMDFFEKYLKGDRNPAEIGTQVGGHETAPYDMTRNEPMPAPRMSMSRDWLFRYDLFLPLKATKEPAADAGRKGVYDVSFLSVHDKRVTGRLYMPDREATGPVPAVIYVHEVNGGKSEAEAFLKTEAAKGRAALAFDLEYHGPRSIPGRKFISPLVYISREAIFQTALDIRRTVDFLESQPEVGPVALVVGKGELSGRMAEMAAGADARIGGVETLPGDLDAQYQQDLAAARTNEHFDDLEKVLEWGK